MSVFVYCEGTRCESTQFLGILGSPSSCEAVL